MRCAPDADIVDGRTLTSWPSLQADLRNAGAEWVDEEFAEGVHEGQRQGASAGA